MKAIIIDDEPRAVQILEMVIKEYCHDITVEGTAHTIVSAIESIKLLKPDIIFLDIELPEGSGFDVLTAFPERDFEVVFVTAYNHYALKAIKYSAADYILKPVDIEEIKTAIEKIQHRKKTPGASSPDLNELLYNLRNTGTRKIAVPSNDSTEFLTVDEIMYVSADRSYCNLFMSDGRNILVAKSLSSIEELLPQEGFFRIHKSHLVNLNYMKKHIRSDGGYIEMTNGAHLSIARMKKEEFLDVIGKWMGKA
ncbi:MAG: DNA-binding response regulator [Bacteroidetes bacterium HGW-Bacteroidetes-21]|jgi:two-component system LytT family response regulator|nr:MAG: DNA-binding response regulator [Bacteroidetes bacterium HGW-Bacteroidetes-21]